MRVKGGPKGHLRHKRVLKANQGFFGSRSKLFRRANEARLKSLWYAFRDRRARKRDLRKLWIVRINAAARINGMSYSKLMNGLKKAGVSVNRKILADLAVNDAPAFTALVETARTALPEDVNAPREQAEATA